MNDSHQLKESFSSKHQGLEYWKGGFEMFFLFPQNTHPHVHLHTHICTQTCGPLFEVAAQILTLTANLEGIKSTRLSSVLSQFSSLPGTAKSRVSKACPRVTGWCLGRFQACLPRALGPQASHKERALSVAPYPSQKCLPFLRDPHVLEHLEDRAHLGRDPQREKGH